LVGSCECSSELLCPIKCKVLLDWVLVSQEGLLLHGVGYCLFLYQILFRICVEYNIFTKSSLVSKKKHEF
jgi:hypothetical protein